MPTSGDTWEESAEDAAEEIVGILAVKKEIPTKVSEKNWLLVTGECLTLKFQTLETRYSQ